MFVHHMLHLWRKPHQFDPFNDVEVGHFVAMNSSIDDMRLDIFFILGKVKATRNVST